MNIPFDNINRVIIGRNYIGYLDKVGQDDHLTIDMHADGAGVGKVKWIHSHGLVNHSKHYQIEQNLDLNNLIPENVQGGVERLDYVDGKLTNLVTGCKDNLVGAINEVARAVGYGGGGGGPTVNPEHPGYNPLAAEGYPYDPSLIPQFIDGTYMPPLNRPELFYLEDEPANGEVNGVNPLFSTNYSWLEGRLAVFVNGILQELGVDWEPVDNSLGMFSLTIPPGLYIMSDVVTTRYQRYWDGLQEIVGEPPVGDINGDNKTFETLSPYISHSLKVNYNGVKLETNEWEEEDPEHGIFRLLFSPLEGDRITVSYTGRYDKTALVYNEYPEGDIDGLNREFLTAHTYEEGTLFVYLNGVYQDCQIDESDHENGGFRYKEEYDPPLEGDVLIVLYRRP